MNKRSALCRVETTKVLRSSSSRQFRPAGRGLFSNRIEPRFEISEPEGRVGDYAQVHYFRVAEDPFNTDLDARMCPPISGGRTGIDADLRAGQHSAEQRAKAFS